ncbi:MULTISPECIES: hypothetical protein [unclassified Coleofasciculus]|uniref:hypothetical protein n=1 Tax=unclassified Coleofasciculus TaxID=2692782 RepID=UPI00187E035D|nr:MULTISPECIES: hypothetical protein [unclassified Coleofasciculus]MBE9129949.1 hypothetical protein [Coleofasciculus sp. LEGE 07081]MBE9150402.1 hypothetical protein [Coleofasciculus sp. LEGE 07092]
MYIIAGLPGLHGLFIATLSIIHYRRTKRGKKCLIVELICSSLLIVAWLLIITNVWLESQSFVLSLFGWWLAAIATLVLNITAIVKAVKAFRTKRNRFLSTIGVLLNFSALIIYLIFALWLTWFFLLALAGASYR